MELTLAELAAILEVHLPQELDEECLVCGFSTDSRTIEQGNVFIALTGEKFDGADYAALALESGASVAVVEREVPELGERQLIVPDTLAALGKIATWWRRRMDVTVIAVTGSAGKTTTKDLIAQICSQFEPTVATVATENNEIGVPQTLLRLTEHDRFCVVEFGMRGRGQIRQLAEIARPDIGVITVIGEAHIGILGSREAIAESKAEMLPLLPEDGTAVLPDDDFFYPLLRGMCGCRVVSFGLSEEAEVRLTQVAQETLAGSTIELAMGEETVGLTVPLPGRHNVLNALAAAGVGYALGFTADQVKSGIESYGGMKMRGEILAGPYGCTIINDAYNANPTSMVAVMEMLRPMPGRKVVLFADMLELGEGAVAAHRKVGEAVAEAGVGLLVTVGELAAQTAEAAEERGVEVRVANTPEEASEFLHTKLREGDIVLIKGSRGMQLERAVKGLLNAE
ncbi:MAG: UDP-N-acetylmuramoyl-tripeptide--D-alanyl-D-alanine ligase [Armatimonadia bacterium]